MPRLATALLLALISGPAGAVSGQVSPRMPNGPYGPRVLNAPVRIIMTGPPGSGKGTYSKLLSRRYGIPHVSVGDLLRAYAQAHPDVAAQMSQGRLVDSGVVLDVVRARLEQTDVVERGFILDGFPRRVSEAAALRTMLGRKRVDAVISLKVPEAELLRRIRKRDRSDDTPEVFQERMSIYREETVPAAALIGLGVTVITPEVSGRGVKKNYTRLKADFERWLKSVGLK